MQAVRQQLNNLKNIHDPYRCLSLAVLANAYSEAKRNNDRGIDSCRWLQGNSASLLFWCEAAQVPVEKLHRRMGDG
jgi:hypothetical protein